MIDQYLKEVTKKMDGVIEARQHEISQIRTGRASPALLEGVNVEAYGGHTPLRQVANISVVEGRTLVVQPWDRSIMSACEKALQKADLGALPQNDGQVLRISLPPLSEERRRDLAKVVKKLGEEGKVALRTIRQDANKHLDHMKKEHDLPEDAIKKAHDHVQKMTDGHGVKVDQIVAAKEEEILNF